MSKDPDKGAMSDESIAYLDDVKKGKPRKFAMICKGASVVSLVIYKKGNVEKRKKEAKEAGKGQFYFGIVDGKGINLRFLLARADGFEDAPVRPTVLKGFLEEAAEFTCKPVFEIVDVVPAVLDEEDPLVVRFLALKSAAETAAQKKPDRANELKEQCDLIARQLDQEQIGDATSNIDKLERLINEVGPSSQSGDESPSKTDSEGLNESLRAKLQDALNKLVPQLKKVVEANPERKVELLSPVATVKKQLDSGDLETAKQGILSIRATLKSITANQPSAPADSSSSNLPQVFESKLNEMYPRYEQALKDMVGDTGRFRAVMAYINEQGEAGGYESAITAIDRLSQAINQAYASGVRETDVIRKGLVAEQVERLEAYLRSRFDEAVRESENEIARIEGAIEEVPNEDPADLTAAIHSEVSGMYDDAARELFAALKQQEPARVLEMLNAWRIKVKDDPLVQHLSAADNSIGVQPNVLASFNDLFDDVEIEIEKVQDNI